MKILSVNFPVGESHIQDGEPSIRLTFPAVKTVGENSVGGSSGGEITGTHHFFHDTSKECHKAALRS